MVVVSCVRKNDGGSIGFTAAWRRINVAMSRAMNELHIVASAETLRHHRRQNMYYYHRFMTFTM